MSVLGHQTNITNKSFFFQLANVSTLVADNIQVKNISSLTAQTGLLTASLINADIINTNFMNVSSLESANIIKAYEFSSVYTYQDIGVISTLFTEHIVLDQATLDVASGNILLLNGVPIATTQNLSSIADWSFEPALSTVEMLGNNILGAGNITCQNIFNALNIQTDTLSALTGLTAPSGTITNLRATNVSSTNLMSSNANIPNLLTFGRGQGSTLALGTLSSSAVFAESISTGTINGIPIISGSNWSQYPATSAVNMNGFDIAGGAQPAFTISATSNLSETAGISYSNTVDRGADVTGQALINLNAKNGLNGRINITADAGIAGIYGQIDITANGGTIPLTGVGTGGLININANTPVGLSNATSAIKLNAAGINSYAGAIPSVASVAGYNFIYGMGGVNICAGLPAGALPNTLGTTYIYGTTGVEVPSQAYMYGITPYWDGLTTPPDLEITGRYILPNFAQVCVRMSNVKQIDFQSNVTSYLSNCDTIGMSANGNIITSNLSATNATIGTLSNTNLVGTGAVSGYTTVGTNNLNTNFINSLPVATYLATTSTFTTASISSATISSINGLPYSAPVGPINRFSTLFTDTFAFSTATSVGSNTLFNVPILLDYDMAGNTTTAGVAIAVQNHNFSGGAVVNRIEMGARANGENYIMSVWPGQNLEELVIDATDVNFRDSDGFSTIINQNPFGVRTNGAIQAPILSTQALNVSSVNGYRYPYTSTLGGVVSTFTVDGITATTPQLIGEISFPHAGDYFLSQKVAFTKLTGGAAQDCHGIMLLNGGGIPTFPGGQFGMGALPYINENGASTFTTVVTNIELLSSGTKQIYYYDATGNNYTASLITDLPVLHFNPGPPT